MNKLKSLLWVLGIVVMSAAVVMAAPGVRGAKKKTVINGSASASLACKGRCTVYSVFISTAASADFAVLRDSNTANTSSAITAYAVSTTSALSQVTFDPPIIFDNGVSLNCAATTPFCGVTTEGGAAVQGY